MLGALENELVALIKESPLGRRLKVVDSLPDTPDKDVIKRWGVEAPAAYVVAMDGSISGDTTEPKFVVVFVARNASGAKAARHGSSKVVGLYEMLDAGVALLNGGSTDGASWRATAYQLLQDVELRNQGLHAAMVAVESLVDTPQPDDESLGLGDFLEFHADFDLAPHAPDEHLRWLGENHDEPAPDMQSHINPQEGI